MEGDDGLLTKFGAACASASAPSVASPDAPMSASFSTAVVAARGRSPTRKSPRLARKSEAKAKAAAERKPTQVRKGSSGELCSDSILRRTATTSKSLCLDQRCDQCDGLTVEECLKLEYTKPNGEKAKYTLGDVRYDLQAERLQFSGGSVPLVACKSKVPPTPAEKAGGKRKGMGTRMKL